MRLCEGSPGPYDTVHVRGVYISVPEGMYGLEVRYELSGEQKDMFTLDADNGTVTLKSEYAQLESVAADITVYVDVIAESPWGGLDNSTTRLTVTIERWAENE